MLQIGTKTVTLDMSHNLREECDQKCIQ